MKLDTFISKLAATVSGQKIKAAASKVLYKEDKALIAKLKEHSAVDDDPKTKNSMVFSENWHAKRLRLGGTGKKSIVSIVIKNTTPLYGQFVAFGARPQKAPWYYPHKHTKGKKKGQMKKGTGKLKMTTGEKEGRVWAGGLNPGHPKTIGGPIEQVFGKNSKEVQNMTKEITDEFIKVFI